MYQTVTVKRPANHVLHLLLTIFTFGLWTPVWIIMACVGRREDVVVPVVPPGIQPPPVQLPPGQFGPPPPRR